jgi:hypothetical protein
MEKMHENIETVLFEEGNRKPIELLGQEDYERIVFVKFKKRLSRFW